MKREAFEKHVEKTLEYFNKVGIVLTEEEKARIEVADF
jgi:hypothetical protein